MAATGGGKIRSRRYHISSKPYAKSRQQQPGLISRVTDTVKSIVPSWLQRYFNSGEEGADDTEQNNQPPPLPPPPPNGGEEEGPPPVDGRDSPEPSNTHTEPSTSRASLNFQDGVLSRPPLNRSHQHHTHHLHFPPLDASSPIMPSSSLFSLPSTSSAAPPGVGPFSTGAGPFSTGFSLVKEIKDNLSQHEDDNISTTSGFSSRASDKDVPTSKTASIPQLWSPETDRTHSGPQQHHHAQSSLKKPSFNLSVFGTSSNASSLNSTVLNSSRLGDSPFYPGKTTYGGASASRSARQPRPSTPYQAPVRRQIKAKPAGAQPCGVTSATAKRILQSLERMSSPLADAKRIPSAASSPLSTSLDGTNLDRSHYQVKRKRLESSPLPPVQKLLIPAAASVSGNRSVSFRPSLTPGGIALLDRTTTPSLTTGGGSIIALDNRTPSLTPAAMALDRTLRDAVRPPSRQSPVIPESDPGPSLSTTISSGPAYPMSSTPAASSAGSGGGKMKRERTSTRPSSKRPEDEEVMEVLDLPAISLPISTFSLPTFSFSTAPPPPTSSINSSPAPFAARPLTPAAKEPVAEKEPPAASTPPCLPFTFASPIVMATAAASPPSFSPSAGFTFSAPVAKMDLSMSNGQLASPITTAVKSTTSNSTEEEFEGPFKPAKTLKQGSVLDLLKAPGFASPSSSPVARSSPGPDAAAAPQQTSSTDSKAPSSSSSTTTTSSSAGFGDLFKAPAAGTWDCDVCLVQNKPSDSKCVACTSLRPGSSSSSSKPADGKPAASAGFAGTLFAAPPAGTWDCDTCLVQNKPEAGKCVACETAKPGTGGGVKQPSLTLSSSTFTTEVKTAAFAAPLTGFGDKFKKAEGAWQCDTCMLDNKGLDAKCVACMSPKPGASTAPTSSSAPSSASGGAPLLGFGDKFKKPEGGWDCDVCCVQNKAADTLCVACQSPKPGATVEPKAFGSSTFGTSGSASGGFKFGSSSSDSTSSGFKFGAAPSDNSSSSSASSAAAGGGFKFGAAFGGGSSSSSETNTDSSGSSGFKFGGSGEGFKFGVTAAPNEDKSSEPAAVGSGFKFGASGGIAFGAGAPVFGLSKPEEKASSDDTPAVPVAASQEKNGDVAPSSDASSAAVSIGESDLLTTTTAPLGGSTFGSLSSEKEPAAPSFTFGNPGEKKDSGAASAAPSFAFSAAGKEADATPAAPGALGGFSFGKPDPPKEQPAPAFSFGNPADKSKDPAAPELPKPSFAFGQSATDAAAAAAPKPAFSFMGTTTTTAAPAPSLFGSTTTTAAAPAPSLFGSITTTAAPAPSLFGSSTTTAAPAPSMFGSTTTTTAAPVPSLFGSSTTTTAAPVPSMFGSTTTTTTAAPTPSLFGSSTTTAAPAPSMFGSTTTTTAAPAPSLFGSITTTAAPVPSMFGTTTTTTTAAPVPSLFGSTTSSSTAPAPSFVFGQAASSSSSSSAGDGPPAKGFLFGGSQESQNPAAAAALAAPSASSSLSSTPSQPFVFGAGPAPSFSFGTTAPSAASSSGPSPFVFSPAPSGGFGASQAPSFGSGFESQAPSPFTGGGASQTPAFGAKPNATPVFGQQANSAPVFGAAANSTPGGGFAFGGASAFGASSSNSTAGVFAFGGGPAGSAAPTASPSITPQPPAPGGFSFAQPPAFNMGATKSSFTASPAGQQQNISGRKIKTAVRRRK